MKKYKFSGTLCSSIFLTVAIFRLTALDPDIKTRSGLSEVLKPDFSQNDRIRTVSLIFSSSAHPFFQGGKAAFARIYTAPLQAFRASPGSLPRLARFGAPRQGWRTHFLTIFKNNHLEQKKGPKLKN